MPSILWAKRARTSDIKFSASEQHVLQSYCTAINKFHSARELALIRKNNLDSFYEFVNSKINSNLNGAALRTAYGTVISDPGEKSEIFNHFFSE